MRTFLKVHSLLSIFLVGASILSCTKTHENPEPVGPEPDVVSNLSSNGTANSYIVPKPGRYSFDATVMGNGVSTKDKEAKSLSPVSAALLWEDTKDLISDVSLFEGRINFNVPGGKNGNAVIAAFDDKDNILWNWHIWVTDYSPSLDGTDNLFNGVHWMDRNLGALTDSWDETGSVKGLIYQWGRKDPFPSLENWTDFDKFHAYDETCKDISDKFITEQVSEKKNLDKAIANPMTFYSGLRSSDGNGPYDWYTTDDYSVENDHLWSTEGSGGKTLFDPCPPGWRVPSISEYKGLNNNSFPTDDVTGGHEHKTIGYFPPSGLRGFEGGIWANVGNGGTYWTSTASENGYVRVLNFTLSVVSLNSKFYRAAGMPVRCVSEVSENPGTPENPEYDLEIKADRIVEAAYKAGDGTDGSSNYYIGLANVDFSKNDQGQYVPSKPGDIVYIDIYSDPSKDSENAILPDGTYSIGSTSTKGIATTDYTWIRHSGEDMQMEYVMFREGEFTVKNTNGVYKITGELTSTDERKISFSYEGELKFTNRGGETVNTTIKDPVNTTFDSAIVTYEHTSTTEGNLYDRYRVDLWSGETKENGQVLVNGYAMVIDLQTVPLSTKENMQLQPGTYTVSSDYKAGNFTAGEAYNLVGVPIYTGTYCQEVRPTNTSVLYGFVKGGTLEIKRNGDKYEFVLDMTTAEGVAIKGTYPMGTVEFIDNSPVEPAGDWLSILREDKNLVFQESDDVFAYGSNYGNAYYEGTSHYEIFVNNHTTNESFYLEFLAPEGAKSPVGTYTAAADPEHPKAGEFIPGYKEFSAFKGTWPYMMFDKDGYEAGGAPGKEGTLIISDAGDGKFKYELSMKDDAEPQNTINAAWTGALNKFTQY